MKCPKSVKELPMLGLLIALVASCLFGLCNTIVKQVSSVDPFTIATYRFVGIALPALSIIIYRNEDPFPRGKRIILIARSVMGASNLIIFFYGLKHMPMADVNMISAGSPIWVVIFARIFLKERLFVLDIINIFITLLGIVFIIKPPFIFGYDPSFVLDHEYYVAGVVVFLGSVIFQSNVYILLRMLKDVHFSVTCFVFGSIGALESSIFSMTLGVPCVPECGPDRLMIVAIGLLSFIVSLQIEEAVKVSIMRKAGDILFAFVFQIFLFNNLPGMWSIVGASLVASAVLISSLKKIVDSLPEDHVMRTNYLQCFYKKEQLQDSNGSGKEEENCLRS